MTPDLATRLGQLALAFGRVKRATFHEDGRTPESDPTHTVMLGLIACEFAAEVNRLQGEQVSASSGFIPSMRAPAHFDVGRIAQLVTVHDLIEARCGDVNSFAITPEAKAAKDKAEAEALVQLRIDFADAPWMLGCIEEYEERKSPEAKLIHYLDKCTPKITHALNKCIALKRMGVSREEAVAAHTKQGMLLAATHPELHALVSPLFQGLCEASETNWGCECSTCLRDLGPMTPDPTRMRMVGCSVCGNKRCPKATYHEHACTGSNEPGQSGSQY